MVSVKTHHFQEYERETKLDCKMQPDKPLVYPFNIKTLTQILDFEECIFYPKPNTEQT